MSKKKNEGGFIDRLVHGDHGHATESEEQAVTNGDGSFESDVPVETSKKSKKSSPRSNDGDSKHHHKKFDKFKKGN